MPENAIPWREKLAAAVLHASPDWPALWASKAIGSAARLPLTPGVARAAVGAYSRWFGVDLAEAETGGEGYRSFDQFFTRRLRDGVRTVHSEAGVMVSPSDGLLRDVTSIGADTRVVAKGHSYAVGELLADSELAERFVGGTSFTVYLHPRDYHRVHSPVPGKPLRVTAVPGRLLPVTAAAIVREPQLFARNERLVHLLDTEDGLVAVVMVAAFGVGHMTCSYADVATHPRRVARIDMAANTAAVAAGDELGIFHLGSTVVVLSERPYEALEDAVGSVRFGQPLLRRKTS